MVLKVGKSQAEATWTESCEQASSLTTTVAIIGRASPWSEAGLLERLTNLPAPKVPFYCTDGQP